jgi:hypothetical protein
LSEHRCRYSVGKILTANVIRVYSPMGGFFAETGSP